MCNHRYLISTCAIEIHIDMTRRGRCVNATCSGSSANFAGESRVDERNNCTAMPRQDDGEISSKA